MLRLNYLWAFGLWICCPKWCNKSYSYFSLCIKTNLLVSAFTSTCTCFNWEVFMCLSGDINSTRMLLNIRTCSWWRPWLKVKCLFLMCWTASVSSSSEGSWWRLRALMWLRSSSQSRDRCVCVRWPPRRSSSRAPRSCRPLFTPDPSPATATARSAAPRLTPSRTSGGSSWYTHSRLHDTSTLN